MRKAILLGVLGLFLASSTAFACGWGSSTSAANGTPDQTATSNGASSKPVTKDVKG